MRKIVVVGGGGHAKVVIDAIKCGKKFKVCAISDPSLKKGDFVAGIPIVGDDGVLAGLFKKGVKDAFVGVGSIGDCSARKKIYDNLKKVGFRLPVIAHPNAVIAGDVELGEGTFVAAGAVVNPGARIGKNAILNTSSSVDHDCVIGDFVHIAPGVTLSGGVVVGEETHIGTGANVIQCVKIGKKCMIPAGTTCLDNVEDGQRYPPIRYRDKDENQF